MTSSACYPGMKSGRGSQAGDREGTDGPDPVDVHVGRRVKRRRIALGLSQSALGDRIGVSFQQVQKYERGANRIAASMIWRIAETLATPPGYFFEGLASSANAELDDTFSDEFLRFTTSGGRELAQAFLDMRPTARRALLILALEARSDVPG